MHKQALWQAHLRWAGAGERLRREITEKYRINCESRPAICGAKMLKKTHIFVIASDPDLIGGAWQSIFYYEIASSSRNLRDSSQ
jgi:thiamine phosphate synthase YjbQ (UPF0047 family)